MEKYKNRNQNQLHRNRKLKRTGKTHYALNHGSFNSKDKCATDLA